MLSQPASERSGTGDRARMCGHFNPGT